MYTHVHYSTTPSIQKVESVQTSISWRMDKQIVVYTYNGMLFTHKKDWYMLQCGWTSKRAKWKKPETKVHILYDSIYKKYSGTSLVAQWSRIHLPMQGTRVRALVREDPTCRRATKPVRHNYWACALEPASHNYWARMPQLLKTMCQEPVLCNKTRNHNEKPAHRNEE